MKTSFEMSQKVLNEEQMREYIESEVRKALISEGIDEGFGMDLINWLGGLFSGGQNGEGFGSRLKNISAEGIIGAILGHIAIAPILTRILEAIGIPADGQIGQLIIKTAVDIGGYSLGQWVDKKWDIIPGVDGKNPAQE